MMKIKQSRGEGINRKQILKMINPNPTNFSNLRSQKYLSSTEADGPSLKNCQTDKMQPKLGLQRQHLRRKNKNELKIENPMCSTPKVPDMRLPNTSRTPMKMTFDINQGHKKAMTPRRANVTPKHIVKLEKLEEKVLGHNDSDVDMSILSNSSSFMDMGESPATVGMSNKQGCSTGKNGREEVVGKQNIQPKPTSLKPQSQPGSGRRTPLRRKKNGNTSQNIPPRSEESGANSSYSKYPTTNNQGKVKRLGESTNSNSSNATNTHHHPPKAATPSTTGRKGKGLPHRQEEGECNSNGDNTGTGEDETPFKRMLKTQSQSALQHHQHKNDIYFPDPPQNNNSSSPDDPHSPDTPHQQIDNQLDNGERKRCKSEERRADQSDVKAPSLKHHEHRNKGTNPNAKNQRYLINLESVLQVEDTIWSILECLRTGAEIIPYCENWWNLTRDEAIPSIEKLFKDENTRRGLRQDLILETIGIAVTQYIMNDLQLSIKCIVHLKNMIFYIHQNFLTIVDFILRRLPPESSQNIWAHSLEAIVMNKRARKMKKGENVISLKQNNEIIISMLRNVCKIIKSSIQDRRPLVNGILNIIKQIERCSVGQVRVIISKALESSMSASANNALLPLFGQTKGPQTDVEPEIPLPVVEAPYLPPLPPRDPSLPPVFTLVLDLDETLVHYYETETEGQVMVRPGTEDFLKKMSELFEIVIFTAAMQDYADWVLDQLDPDKYITHRCYRQHALPYGAIFVKDISRLGRDLSKTIIVDNVAENFQLQPDNGIYIRSWFDDMNDTALDELAPLLKEIVIKNVPDVREALRRFRDQMIEQISKGVENPQLSLD